MCRHLEIVGTNDRRLTSKILYNAESQTKNSIADVDNGDKKYYFAEKSKKIFFNSIFIIRIKTVAGQNFRAVILKTYYELV